MEYIHAGNNKQCLKWVKHSHMNIYIYSEKQETLFQGEAFCYANSAAVGQVQY